MLTERKPKINQTHSFSRCFFGHWALDLPIPNTKSVFKCFNQVLDGGPWLNWIHAFKVNQFNLKNSLFSHNNKRYTRGDQFNFTIHLTCFKPTEQAVPDEMPKFSKLLFWVAPLKRRQRIDLSQMGRIEYLGCNDFRDTFGWYQVRGFVRR